MENRIVVIQICYPVWGWCVQGPKLLKGETVRDEDLIHAILTHLRKLDLSTGSLLLLRQLPLRLIASLQAALGGFRVIAIHVGGQYEILRGPEGLRFRAEEVIEIEGE